VLIHAVSNAISVSGPWIRLMIRTECIYSSYFYQVDPLVLRLKVTFTGNKHLLNHTQRVGREKRIGICVVDLDLSSVSENICSNQVLSHHRKQSIHGSANSARRQIVFLPYGVDRK
jgi:hypothetical protein